MPPNDLIAMVTFARVVEAGSFTRAARLLEVSKSVVSMRVSFLERRLGARLLLRSTRRLSVTTEGARLYERCSRILRAVEDAAEDVRGEDGEPVGTLRLSASATFHDTVLADLLARYLLLHPRARIEVIVTDSIVNLVESRVDLAIRIAPSVQGGGSLGSRRLASIRKGLFASPAYLASRGGLERLGDLAHHACFRFQTLPQEAEWSFRDLPGGLGFKLQGPLASDSVETLRQGALRGLGIALLFPYAIAADVASGRLVPVLEKYPLQPVSVFAVHTYTGFVPAKVRVFSDFLAAELGGRQL